MTFAAQPRQVSAARCSCLHNVIHDLIPSSASHALLPRLFDHGGFCESYKALPDMAGQVRCIVVAFCLLPGASLCSVDIEKLHIRALHLPEVSRLLRHVRPPPPVRICEDWYTDAEDRLVPPWVSRAVSVIQPDMGPPVSPCGPPADIAWPATPLVSDMLHAPCPVMPRQPKVKMRRQPR